MTTQLRMKIATKLNKMLDASEDGIKFWDWWAFRGRFAVRVQQLIEKEYFEQGVKKEYRGAIELYHKTLEREDWLYDLACQVERKCKNKMVNP